jgi:hypothetical protein
MREGREGRERFVFLCDTATRPRIPAALWDAFREDLLHTLSFPLLRATVRHGLPIGLNNLGLNNLTLAPVWESTPPGAYCCFVAADTPHLPRAFVQEAFGRLARGASEVIGQADNGGIYLWAVRGTDPELLRATAVGDIWESAREPASGGQLLPSFYRIKFPNDLARLRRDLWRGVAHAPNTGARVESVQGESLWF